MEAFLHLDEGGKYSGHRKQGQRKFWARTQADSVRLLVGHIRRLRRRSGTVHSKLGPLRSWEPLEAVACTCSEKRGGTLPPARSCTRGGALPPAPLLRWLPSCTCGGRAAPCSHACTIFSVLRTPCRQERRGRRPLPPFCLTCQSAMTSLGMQRASCRQGCVFCLQHHCHMRRGQRPLRNMASCLRNKKIAILKAMVKFRNPRSCELAAADISTPGDVGPTQSEHGGLLEVSDLTGQPDVHRGSLLTRRKGCVGRSVALQALERPPPTVQPRDQYKNSAAFKAPAAEVKKPARRAPSSSAAVVAATSTSDGPPFTNLRLISAAKPERTYLTGLDGAKRRRLITEVTAAKCSNHRAVMQSIMEQIAQHHLDKGQATTLRNDVLASLG